MKSLTISVVLFSQAHENDCDLGTLDSAVGSGSLAESSSLNIEVQSSDASNTAVSTFVWLYKILS